MDDSSSAAHGRWEKRERARLAYQEKWARRKTIVLNGRKSPLYSSIANARANAPKTCLNCASTEKIYYHHVNYFPEKVIPLCRECHNETNLTNARNLAHINPPQNVLLLDSYIFGSKDLSNEPLTWDYIILIYYVDLIQKLRAEEAQRKRVNTLEKAAQH